MQTRLANETVKSVVTLVLCFSTGSSFRNRPSLLWKKTHFWWNSNKYRRGKQRKCSEFTARKVGYKILKERILVVVLFSFSVICFASKGCVKLKVSAQLDTWCNKTIWNVKPGSSVLFNDPQEKTYEHSSMTFGVVPSRSLLTYSWLI